MKLDLSTEEKITWCPGCPNNQILVAFRQAIEELVTEGALELHNLVAGSGIGCHGKISDYLDVNTFSSLHGRIIPTLTGIKIANPKLTVVGFTGDGDSFSEGFNHITHAARSNSDISIFLHNNKVFALTAGQATTTSPKGFKGGTTPNGSVNKPLNPTLIMLTMGATFVARTFAGDITKTKEIMKVAVLHKGFAFVEILQPCITFFDTREHYKERVYWLDEKHKKGNLDSAFRVVRQNSNEKISCGIIYQTTKQTFEEVV